MRGGSGLGSDRERNAGGRRSPAGERDCRHTDASALLRLLAEAGYKLTGPRRALAEEIAGRVRAFTAAEVLEAIAHDHPDIGRATVFRTLDCLVKLGAITRVHLDNGAPAYVRCAPSAAEHHHHLICSNCGAVVDLPECPVDSTLERIGREQGFRILGHRLEVFGQCRACAG